MDGILGEKWIITELANCLAITTESGRTYFANGVCQCEGFFRDQPCKHRAAARLIAIYNETATPAVYAPAENAGALKSGNRQNRQKPAAERDSLIADIKAAWSAKFPADNLADELMRRFRVNSLNFLADDMLAGVLAAIA